MITSVMVANRGEIARRVFRTCRTLGLATVAVFSDPDADAPHVREADAAVHLPGNAAADTYLRADALIAAARAAGADAVHPGYGFLSENAEFAQAVLDAGLTWIGPPPEAIRAMGSKIEAKKLMAAAGVPVLDELAPEALAPADLPVLIKASAGGGGRGMRVVTDLADLPAALEAAQAEAASAFGDPTVFCEPYLPAGRHIEVQVMADRHGTVWTVGERECSIQRRHQKVIEEAPSPLVERTPGMRQRLLDASSAAALAIDYVGAGTVEFLADEDGRFFFLEMNTRLQVEHPVTEGTTGLDLVELQLRVADGHRLPEQCPPTVGHCIEARLYAEDPAHGWQPQSGTLHRLSIPGVDAEFETSRTGGLRLDSGVVDGSVVGIHYDPMLAKVVSQGATRSEAAHRLATALARARIHGLVTNRDLLVRVLRHDAFLAGDIDTGFLDRHGLDALAAPLLADPATGALAAALADAAAERASATVLDGLPSGWRNVWSQPQRRAYDGYEVSYRLDRGRLVGQDGVELVEATPDRVVLELDGVRRTFEVARYEGLVCVDSPLGALSLRPLPRYSDPADAVAPGSLRAPMPGTVVRVVVEPGAEVTRGQPLLYLEAMKMEHTVAAPTDGVVAELNVTAGQQVEVGATLVVVR